MREIQFNHSIKLFFSRNAFHMVTHFQKSNFFHFLKLSVKTYEPSNLSENLSKHQLSIRSVFIVVLMYANGSRIKKNSHPAHLFIVRVSAQ